MCYFSVHCSCQRKCERCIMFPSNRPEWLYVLHSSLHLSTTHPCLLSSSGSGPVELEHTAQLLSAGKDFTLRGEKVQFQHQHGRCHFPPTCYIIFLRLHKTGRRWQFQHKACFPHINVPNCCYLFNLYLSGMVS